MKSCDDVSVNTSMSTVGQKLKKLVTRLIPKSAGSPTEPGYYCLVGNVVKEHAFGTAHELKQGTKHFTPGTKVYCLPSQWGDGYEKIIAVGICRKSRRWITVVMQTEHITNWRGKSVYSPVVLKRLRDGFEGFNAQWKSHKQVDDSAAGLRRRYGAES